MAPFRDHSGSFTSCPALSVPFASANASSRTPEGLGVPLPFQQVVPSHAVTGSDSAVI